MKTTTRVRSLKAIPGAIALIVTSLLLADYARAATIVFYGTNFDIQVSTPVDVGVTPLKAVTLTAIGKNSALPTTFDSTNSGFGGNGITTSGNHLHQVWQTVTVSTPINTPVFDPDQTAVDTHFLVDSGTYLASPPFPEENRPIDDPTEDPMAGYGDALWGTFSLLSAVGATWDFAYLVVPSQTEVSLDFEIGADGFASETVGGSFVVPEPGTLVLLALGTLGLLPLVRRRRQA